MVFVFIASEDELKTLQKRVSVRKKQVLGGGCLLQVESCGGDFVLVQCGIGPKKASGSARTVFKQARPGLVIIVGAAGALDPALHVGDVVVVDRIVRQNTKLVYSCDADLREKARELLQQAGNKVHTGSCLTGKKFVHLQKDKNVLFQTAGCCCVDMESAAIAGVCDDAGIPFMNIRIISDTARKDTFDAETIVRIKNRNGIPGMVLYWIKRPGEFFKAFIFRMTMRRVSRSIADVVLLLRDIER